EHADVDERVGHHQREGAQQHRQHEEGGEVAVPGARRGDGAAGEQPGPGGRAYPYRARRRTGVVCHQTLATLRCPKTPSGRATRTAMRTTNATASRRPEST